MPDNLDAFAILAHVDRTIDVKITEAIHTHELENAQHITEFKRQMTEQSQKLVELEALIKSGFPNEDPPSHCRVHEQYIRDAQERDKMLKGTKHKVMELSVWAVIVLVATAVWDYIKVHIK